MRKRWKYVRVTTIDKNGKIRDYDEYLCPRCFRRSIVQTKYCPDCGKKLGKAVK